MTNIYNDLIKTPLTSMDVMRIGYGISYDAPFPISNCIKFFTYNELKDVSYPQKDCAYVILYRSSENFGHFVALLNRGDKVLEFFDPYDLKPDKQQKWLDDDANMELDQLNKYLSHIMNSFEGRLEYNEMKFQKMKDSNDNTCGRHVGFRIYLRFMTLKQYQNMLRDLHHKTGLPYNKIVVLFTENILNSGELYDFDNINEIEFNKKLWSSDKINQMKLNPIKIKNKSKSIVYVLKNGGRNIIKTNYINGIKYNITK